MQLYLVHVKHKQMKQQYHHEPLFSLKTNLNLDYSKKKKKNLNFAYSNIKNKSKFS